MTHGRPVSLVIVFIRTASGPFSRLAAAQSSEAKENRKWGCEESLAVALATGECLTLGVEHVAKSLSASVRQVAAARINICVCPFVSKSPADAGATLWRWRQWAGVRGGSKLSFLHGILCFHQMHMEISFQAKSDSRHTFVFPNLLY